MAVRSIKALPVVLAIMANPVMALAGSCSATNESGGKCSIDCTAGQAAQCANATGANDPSCECKSSDQSFYDNPGISKWLTLLAGSKPMSTWPIDSHLLTKN